MAARPYLLCRGVNRICGRQAKYRRSPRAEQILFAMPRRNRICGRQAKYRRSPRAEQILFAMPRRSTAEFTDSVMNTAAYSWHGDARCFHRGRIRNSLKRPVHSTGIPSCLCPYEYRQRQDNANGNISRRILFHFPAKVWHESEEKLCGIEIPGLPGSTMSAF